MRAQYQTRSFRFQGYTVMEGVQGLPIDGFGKPRQKD